MSGLAVAIAVYHGTVPVLDSDLWYHLTYARQMWHTGSLIPDHTAFSHTPASNAVLYCAWVAQLSFFALYEWAGLPALFGLRYLVLASIVVSWIAHARRDGVFLHPVAWGLVVVGVWTMGDAAALKPQLWSIALLALTVFVYRRWRDASTTHSRWLLAWPAVMLLWVNTHGGFVMGLLYQFAILAGELLDHWGRAATGLPRPALRMVLLAVVTSVIAVWCTPYLWHYPLQFLTVSLPTAHLAAVRDYDSIFAVGQRPLRYVERGALLLLLCAWVNIWRREGTSSGWATVLPAVAFFGAYASLTRLTPFLAPVVVPTAIGVLARGTLHRPFSKPTVAMAVCTVAALCGFSAFEVQANATAVPIGAWRGLGTSYVNPVDEAEYLAQHYPDIDIGNDYNTGGYLLFSRWPRGKVFIDARYFPYRDWFTDYLRLESGTDPQALIQRHPVNVWVVHLGLSSLLQWFQHSPDWRPEFAGRSAVVFVRRGHTRTDGALRFTSRLEGMRNAQQAFWLSIFALEQGRRDLAHRIIDSYGGPLDSGQLQQTRRLLTALDAVAAGDRVAAIAGFHALAPFFGRVAHVALASTASAEADMHWQAARWREALALQRVALAAVPDSMFLRHNVAVMAWWVETTGGVDEHPWRDELRQLAAGPAEEADGFAAGRTQCIEILSGARRTPPRLYVLPMPQ